jgi:hypothetical protein
VRVRGRYAAWPALAVVLAVGACSGGDDPPPSSSTSSGSSSSSSTSTTTTSSPSTTATATVKVPAAAQKHTPEGAAAFVKFYLDQINVAWTTPKAGIVAQLSDPSCESCASFEDTAAQLAKDGQRYSATPSTFTTVRAYSGAPAGQQLVRVIGTQRKVDIVDSSGRVIKTDPRQSIAANALAIWKGDRWLMYDLA